MANKTAIWSAGLNYMLEDYAGKDLQYANGDTVFFSVGIKKFFGLRRRMLPREGKWSSRRVCFDICSETHPAEENQRTTWNRCIHVHGDKGVDLRNLQKPGTCSV